MALIANNEPFEFDGELVHETEEAFLVSDGENEHWLPKSLTEYDGKNTFTMPEWLAIQEGIV